jgi:HlyD family secretion protein
MLPSGVPPTAVRRYMPKRTRLNGFMTTTAARSLSVIHQPRRRVVRWGIFLCVVACSAGAVVRHFEIAVSFFAGLRSGAADVNDSAPPEGTAAVTRGPLALVLTERGALECSRQSVLTSKVEWDTKLTSVLPEGTWVRKGDVVATLDVSKLKDELGDEQGDVLEAEAALDAAKQNLRILEIENSNAIIKATTARDIANMTLDAFEKAEFPKQVSDLELLIAKAFDSLHSAREQLAYTERQVRKQFKTAVDIDRDRLALLRAEETHADLVEQLRVLREHTYARQLSELKGLASQALSTLMQQTSLARTKALSGQMQLEIQQRRLMRQTVQYNWTQKMLSYCEIRAPHDGQLLYANEDRDPLEQVGEGMAVRFMQPLLVIPDRTHMQIAVRVHESLRRLLAVGMSAEIRLDSTPDRKLTGKVERVSSFPLTGRWPNRDLRQYEAVVRLDGDCLDLTPGLSAKVDLVAASKDDALQVPVQAVTEIGDRYVAFVAAGGQVVPREVFVGESTQDQIEILGGIEEGERVFLNPRESCPDAVVACERTEETQDEEQVLVAD